MELIVRRVVSRLLCLIVVAVMGVLAGCSSSTAPGGANRKGSAVSKEAGASPVSDAVGTIGVGFVAQSVLRGILAFGGSQAAGFVMEAIRGPDATTQSLDALQTELSSISTQLDDIQSSIKELKSDIVDLQKNKMMTEISDWSIALNTIYNRKLRPIADAAVVLHNAKATGKTASAEEDLQSKIDAFGSAFQIGQVDTITGRLHARLMPNSGYASILNLTGQSMMGKGYVSSVDSTRLRQLYASVSDQEALSVRLTLEYDLMTNDTAAYKRDAKTYQDYVAAETANLPPLIPTGYVVDTQNRSTTNTQMYMAPSANATGAPVAAAPWAPSNLWIDPTKQVLADNPGWALPTGAQMKSLYDATKTVPTPDGAPPSSVSGTTRLTNIWSVAADSGVSPAEVETARQLGTRWGQARVWTTDQEESNPMTCIVLVQGSVNPKSRSYMLHRVADFSQPDAVVLRSLPASVPSNHVIDSPYSFSTAPCDQFLSRLYLNGSQYKAGFILTQPSKADYMAQKTTAVVAS